MAGPIERAANLRQPARHAGRRLVVDDQHGPDAMVTILTQPGFERRRIDAVAPVSRHDLHVESQPARDLGPASRELSDVEGEHAIARRQRIDQGRLPGAGARRGKDHHGRGGLENRLQPVENGPAQRRELRAPVIDGRLRHRPQHTIGCVGRPRYLQKVSAAPMHGRTSYPDLSRSGLGLGTRGSRLRIGAPADLRHARELAASGFSRKAVAVGNPWIASRSLPAKAEATRDCQRL